MDIHGILEVSPEPLCEKNDNDETAPAEAADAPPAPEGMILRRLTILYDEELTTPFLFFPLSSIQERKTARCLVKTSPWLTRLLQLLPQVLVESVLGVANMKGGDMVPPIT